MAHEHLPDFDELLAELVGPASGASAACPTSAAGSTSASTSSPNELDAAREKAISAERRELHVRIDALRAQLRPLIGTPESPTPPPRLGA